MRNVLVTGGRGFIGRHLVRQLAAQGARVTSVDVTPVQGDDGPVREVVLDTRDDGQLVALGRASSFDTVFDLASRTEIGLERDAYRGNVQAIQSVLRFVQECAIQRYLFFSTQFVFRKPNALPGAEDEFYPIDPYGESKVACEVAIRETLAADRYLILRPAYVWGPGLQRFRDGLLYRLAKGQLMISSDRSLLRYYGYVETVCAQAISLSARPFHELPHKVYYLSDDGIPLKTFCDELQRALGQGGYREVAPALLRALGQAGDAARRIGVKSPITSVQARELTTSFPIPIQRTLDMVPDRTDLRHAAEETVAWAKTDSTWLARITS